MTGSCEACGQQPGMSAWRVSEGSTGLTNLPILFSYFYMDFISKFFLPETFIPLSTKHFGQCCGSGMIYPRSGYSFEFSEFRIHADPYPTYIY